MSVFDLQAHTAGWMWNVLPPNGLDRSLHAPVLVGLVLLALFKELFGWSYAGVVVPGYLASVFIVAPVTGVLVLGESVIAYLIAAALGRWLPVTGAWSSFFGRERFLLLILTALFTRLWVEASLVPIAVQRLELSHSRELYSIGLVLVPLLANSFWNAGMKAAFPRVMFLSALTFVIVQFVIMRHTNFSVARFQVANESVSLQFLDSPHAYIILLTGAVLGARDNVRYGWDYNGILVPALLAVACYQPTKLATTIIEALVVLKLSKWVTSHGPLAKVLIVGSRRMVVAFCVGFTFKLISGHLLYLWLPQVKMIDYFGFGYLLPTLLAVKMWNTDKIGVTIMPTIQVAVSSFILGNGVGIGLRLLEGASDGAPAQSRPLEAKTPLALDLMLGDTAPAPEPPRAWWASETQAQLTLRVIREAITEPPRQGVLSSSWPSSLLVSSRDSGWWTIVPRSLDPNADILSPRVALQIGAAQASPWAIIIDEPLPGAPSFVIAEELAAALSARAIFVRSRLERSRPFDEAFIEAATELLSIEHHVLLRVGGTDATLSSVGGLPQGISVTGLEALLGTVVNLSWRTASTARSELNDAVLLTVPESLAAKRGATLWTAPEVANWKGPPEAAIREHIDWLTAGAKGTYHPPSVEELRLFGDSVLPALVPPPERTTPSEWQRALAHRLGYAFATIGANEAWALFEPDGTSRIGHATFVTRTRAARHSAVGQRVLMEVPAPRWERGIVNASLALFAGLGADGLLLSGTMPDASPEGESDMRRQQSLRSYYQRAHEVWLAAGGLAVGVRAIGAESTGTADAIVAFEAPESSPIRGPEWTRPVVGVLHDNALSLGVVDGGLETASYSGFANSAMSYARNFGKDQMMLLWLSSDAREVLAGVRDHPLTAERVTRAGGVVRELPLGDAVSGWSRCRQRPEFAQVASQCEWLGPCSSDEAVQALYAYTRTSNPNFLIRALKPHSGCKATVVRDAESKQLWGLAPTGRRITLVPLRGRPVDTNPELISDPMRVGPTISLGLTAITLEVEG